MFYKHWKKILLSLTAFFWASCDNSSSAEDDNASSSSSAIETPKSSSATASPESSSTTEGPATSSETATPESSSSAEGAASSASEDDPNITSSTSVDKSSSSMGEIAAKYGVPMSSSSMVAAKYGIMMPTCEKFESNLTCDDGVTCTEETKESFESTPCDGDVCAKYGVVIVKESTYKCSDGKTYNEAEFRSKYQILDGAVDLYGCPSDICGPDTLIEENLPLYGVSSAVMRPNN